MIEAQEKKARLEPTTAAIWRNYRAVLKSSRARAWQALSRPTEGYGIFSPTRSFSSSTRSHGPHANRGARHPRFSRAGRHARRAAARVCPAVFPARRLRRSPAAIGEEQTISQPYIVAAMLERLDLQATDRVLEIGTGSGYVTALLSLLSARCIRWSATRNWRPPRKVLCSGWNIAT